MKDYDLKRDHDAAWELLAEIMNATDSGYDCVKCGQWTTLPRSLCLHCIITGRKARMLWNRRIWGCAWDRKPNKSEKDL